VCLGSRKHLVDGQRSIESFRRDPPLLVDELATQHGDLRHRTAPRQQTEAEEPPEQREEAQSGWVDVIHRREY
jgi:hypothetical protein